MAAMGEAVLLHGCFAFFILIDIADKVVAAIVDHTASTVAPAAIIALLLGALLVVLIRRHRWGYLAAAVLCAVFALGGIGVTANATSPALRLYHATWTALAAASLICAIIAFRAARRSAEGVGHAA
jgi:hypothetical protein